MNKTKQLESIFHQLNIGDAVQRNNACSEILEQIAKSTDSIEQDRLRQGIIYHLIDLGRAFDADEIIKSLQLSSNLDMRAASFFHRIEFCKKILKDPIQVESSIRDTIAFTEKMGLEAAKTDAYMEYGRFLSEHGYDRKAITIFTEVACYSENNHNLKLLSATKYYIGLCLYHLGYLTMANSYLREATEIAYRERNHILAQTSEVLRAIVLMKQGKNDEAYVIFQQWERNFSYTI